jgi:hypothetical protein
MQMNYWSSRNDGRMLAFGFWNGRHVYIKLFTRDHSSFRCEGGRNDEDFSHQSTY